MVCFVRKQKYLSAARSKNRFDDFGSVVSRRRDGRAVRRLLIGRSGSNNHLWANEVACFRVPATPGKSLYSDVSRLVVTTGTPLA